MIEVVRVFLIVGFYACLAWLFFSKRSWRHV